MVKDYVAYFDTAAQMKWIKIMIHLSYDQAADKIRKIIYDSGALHMLIWFYRSVNIPHSK